MAARFSEEVLEALARALEAAVTKGQPAAVAQAISGYDDDVVRKTSSALKFFDVASVKCAAESTPVSQRVSTDAGTTTIVHIHQDA